MRRPPFLLSASIRGRDGTGDTPSATTTIASASTATATATATAMVGGFGDDDDECDCMGVSGRGGRRPSGGNNNGDESRSIVHSVSPDGAMHPTNPSSRCRVGGDDDDDARAPAIPASPPHPSSLANFFLPRSLPSSVIRQKDDNNDDDADNDINDRIHPFHRPRYGPDDQSSSSSSSETSSSDDGSPKKKDDAECDKHDVPIPPPWPPSTDGGGGGDAMITPPSSFMATLSFSTPPPIIATSKTMTTTPPGLFGRSIPPRSWSSPPRRLPGGDVYDNIDQGGGKGEDSKGDDVTSPSSSRRRQHPQNQQQQQRRRQRPYVSANVANNDATPSDDHGPFTPRGRRMMQELSIGGGACAGAAGCLDNSWSSTSSSHVGGVPGRGWSSSTIVPTLRSTARTTEGDTANDASSANALSFPSPGRIFGVDASSSSFSLGESGHSVVSSTTTTHCAFATPQPTPKRPPQHSSPNRATRITTPIGRQRGSVFRMPPPRLTPQHAIVHPPVATPSSMTTPMSEQDYGCPSSSNHAYWSSPQSSLASTASTCASRLVPLTVLSRDGSPVVHRPSARPSPAGSSPLMRSLDKATVPRTPTMLPSLRRSDDAGSTPGGGAANATGLPLPKIRLTPRGGGHGLSSLVHSPIALLEENDSENVDAHPHWLRPTFPAKFSPIPPSSGMDHTSFGPSSLSSFGMGDEDVMAEMDSLLDGFGHHEASFDRGQGCDLLPPGGGPPEDRAGPSRKSAEGGEGEDGFDRVESEEAEMVALLTQGPPSPRKNHHCHRSRPMPSITLKLESIEGSGGTRGLSLSKSPSFLPRPVPVVQGGTRSLFDTTKDPIEGILLADAIAEAAKSNEPLTDDEGSEFEGNHSDFLLSLPLADHKGRESHVAPPSSAPSLNPRQAEATLTTMRKRYFFRPRLPSVDSPDLLGDPWDAIEDHVPLVAAAQEGLNKRAFSDAARRDSPSVPSSMELATSVPKYSRPNANDSDAVAPIGMGRPSTSAAACSLLSMSSLCGLNIVHEMSDHSFRRHSSTPPLPPSESSEFALAGVTLFRSELSANSLGFSVDSNDGCVYQRDLFTPPVSMD